MRMERHNFTLMRRADQGEKAMSKNSVVENVKIEIEVFLS
jgi:hypothetical protein